MTFRRRLLIFTVVILAILGASCAKQEPARFTTVSTIAGTNGEFAEPFGLATKGSDIFVSDGANGKILKVAADGSVSEFAKDFDTPSSIAFSKNGDLIITDSGSNTIRSISSTGEVRTIAGKERNRGFADGDAQNAQFNGPIGIAVATDGRIFVSDTYNDRIRVIENGRVSTFAGSARGYRDGHDAQFDTPLGIAIWKDKLLVADAGNRRIRVIEPDGSVWTLAGSGAWDSLDGQLLDSSFAQPTAIAVNDFDQIFIADRNAIRMIGRGVFPYVVTLTDRQRGFRDGRVSTARLNRLSGIAIGSKGELFIADSDNGLVRQIGSNEKDNKSKKIEALQPKHFSADEFKQLQPPRWPYDPPYAKRDVAGTLGELRGTIQPGDNDIWFHNGLDIAGQYGETARFIRSEKLLDPISTDNFGDLRELIRLPQLGYIHVRLGRDQKDTVFPDARFQPIYDQENKLAGIRIARGTKFNAGDPIGTLNAMNHVHLIAGPSDREMNALAALTLPNVADSVPPTIESTSIYDQNWQPLETKSPRSRIKIAGKMRIVVRAFDRMDGNPERRKLGLYKLGFQVFRDDGTAVAEPNWTIVFDRMPPNAAVKFVYANGSHSGASGETIFNYIVTNRLEGSEFSEGFLDAASFPAGNYFIRVLAADYFGNISTKDIPIEVIK